MFDPLGNIVKFSSAENILLAFWEFRILFYEKQRLYTLKQLELDCLVLTERARFIQKVTDKTLNIFNAVNVHELLTSHGFTSNPETNPRYQIHARDYYVTDKEIA
jgi:DNA topoisomerase-2